MVVLQERSPAPIEKSRDSERETHRHSMAIFGEGMKAVEAVARAL
jgi:hypothetical protein